MTEFPYTQVTGKLKSFFEKIQQVGKPDVLDQKWLASVGLSNINDRTIVQVLKFIGFVDPSGKPTNRWMAYRGDRNTARKVLAEGILGGYDGLFQMYPDAYQRSDDELKSFFGTRTKGGAQVISKTVTTFKILCDLADFSVAIEGPFSQAPTPSWETEVGLGTPQKVIQGLGTGVTININIQLTLPDTTDETVYDKFFAAMKKHLLS